MIKRKISHAVTAIVRQMIFISLLSFMLIIILYESLRLINITQVRVINKHTLKLMYKYLFTELEEQNKSGYKKSKSF